MHIEATQAHPLSLILQLEKIKGVYSTAFLKNPSQRYGASHAV